MPPSPQMIPKQPPSPAKSASLITLRKATLQQVPFWRNQRDLSSQEQQILETQWNSRHSVSSSRVNSLVTPNCRDYFDRPRPVLDAVPFARPVVQVKPTWLLKYPADGSSQFDGSSMYSELQAKQEPSMRPSATAPALGATVLGALAGQACWNDRHHVTHSVGNSRLHDNDREYFGRFVAPRSKRVVQQRPKGLTAHHYAYADARSAQGRDDDFSPAELLLLADDFGPLPLPPAPGRTSSDRSVVNVAKSGFAGSARA